jgi:hypothetical protein
MEQFETELMKVFNCNCEWPICLYDFTYKNKIPNYFCFKVEADINSLIIDNYFSEANRETLKRDEKQN